MRITKRWPRWSRRPAPRRNRAGWERYELLKILDIHPHVIRSALVKSPEILDYRVRQTRRGIDLEALALASVNSDALAQQLVQALAAAGLHNPAVSIRIVDHLERIPDTGKLRRFLPLP